MNTRDVGIGRLQQLPRVLDSVAVVTEVLHRDLQALALPVQASARKDAEAGAVDKFHGAADRLGDDAKHAAPNPGEHAGGPYRLLMNQCAHGLVHDASHGRHEADAKSLDAARQGAADALWGGVASLGTPRRVFAVEGEPLHVATDAHCHVGD